MKPKNIVPFLITLLLVSCLSLPAESPTATPLPTHTFMPSSTTPTPIPTLTKGVSLTPTETPIPTETFAPLLSERAEGDSISGTYLLWNGDAGYCALRAVLQPFLMSFEEVVVELYCIRSPSYDTGYAHPQKILLADHIAVYPVPEEHFNETDDLADAPCHFVLEFGHNTVKVTQVGSDSDCGFGHAVYANGVYKLVDPKPPVVGCLDIENPCSVLYPLP
jgi:hypothetical protein